MLTKFMTRLRLFREDVKGNVSIDMVVFAPLMFLVLGATFTLYDAFRQKSLNVKASYTIADAISRETDPVDDAYLEGMVDLLEYLTSSSGPYSMRVTLVRFDDDADTFHVDWSQGKGEFTPMDDAEVESKREQLPDLLDNERIIVVETQTDYLPPIFFDGFEGQQFYNIGFTRPRFAPKVVWSDTPASG